MFIDEKAVLEAEHKAVERVILYSDDKTPEDYGLERIRGIWMLADLLLRSDKEGG